MIGGICRRFLEAYQDFLLASRGNVIHLTGFIGAVFSLFPSRAMHVNSFMTITFKSRYPRCYAPTGFGMHGLVTGHALILLELSPTNWSACGAERRIGESVGMSSPDSHWPAPVWNCCTDSSRHGDRTAAKTSAAAWKPVHCATSLPAIAGLSRASSCR